MTTEIAVINRLGVALAADSAVTISSFDGGDKVFNTGDKLFELSERHPVALMVNGSMDFLGVPWEIIAKQFRQIQPSDADQRSIRQWMDSFLAFLAAHRAVKPEDVSRWQDGLLREELDDLDQTARAGIAAPAGDTNEGAQQSLKGLLMDAMDERIRTIEAEPVLDSLEDVSRDEVASIAASLVTRFVEEGSLAWEEDQTDLLSRLLASRLLRDMNRITATGIIISGFGGDDLFPSLCAIEIDGHVASKLRYRQSHNVTIDRGRGTGTAISFAQTDVVDRLLRGTDSRFIAAAADFIRKNVAGGLKFIAKRSSVEADGKAHSGIYAAGLGDELGNLVADMFQSRFAEVIQSEFERKFRETISLMPKQDLIELAEALVSITAIERKASDDAGTVGGPIDVALITRAEGFVWIKRKHHFNAELNPRYMWRRFGSLNLEAGGQHGKTRN